MLGLAPQRRHELVVGEADVQQMFDLQGKRGQSSKVGIVAGQGLTLVQFSAQLEPCLTHKTALNTLNTLNTPYHPLNMAYTIPTRTPYPIECAQVELRSDSAAGCIVKSGKIEKGQKFRLMRGEESIHEVGGCGLTL
jgi:hypothetical protein